mgnify:FL=1|tara:strand:- start:143 stop:718 length:576 start_codon:yes stop_codon:yes gene_type:complete
MNTNELVSVENIAYKINDKKLFYNVSFFLEKGEALHIYGSNGSGKSTLIRIILGITTQTKGDVNIFSEKKICYLGHKNAIKSYLSIEDNLLIMGLTSHPNINKYIDILELRDCLDVVVGNLSFGQQKKVALLRVFLNDSDLIILDEPFVGLDSDTQNLLNQFLIEELNTKKGLIFTSHIKCEINSKTINLE